MNLRDLLRVIGPGQKNLRNLSLEEAQRAFEVILAGEESNARMAAFLVSLKAKGTTVEELRGFAAAARARATVPCTEVPGLVSLCSPTEGQDGVPPLDVAAGLIAAGAGARVLLLTDRCVPPKRGLTAASVLEHLGCGMTWDASECEEWVVKARFGACAVSGMLPALAPLREFREEIGVRTALSTVEKLLAPPGSSVVVGAQPGPVLGTAIEVVTGLEHPRALALQGPEGSLIPMVSKRTRGIELIEGDLVAMNVEPEDFGLAHSQEPELPLFSLPAEGQGAGDTPGLVRAAGEITEEVLSGEPSGARNAALLGAGLILKASGRSMTLADGVDEAVRSLDSGAPRAVLDPLRDLAE